MVVALSARDGLLVAQPPVVARHLEADPGPVLVVYPVLPGIGPQTDVLLDVLRVLGRLPQQGCRCHALSLDPKVLLGVAPLLVRPVSVDEAPMLGIVRQVPGAIEQLSGPIHHPTLGRMPVDVEQVLGPLILVPWLEAPRPVDVGGIVLVVLPVNLEILGVVLPDEAVCLSRQRPGEGHSQHCGPVQVTLVLCSLKCGDKRLTHVHI
mmetsp:Transcript_124261/g.310623  ORF Transcript_124261/g.310623 Transcript_124261/m.310623 type:complete len:207 (-) Transcript_124261:675-1295(-)